jgi:6-phosphogluconolactonase
MTSRNLAFVYVSHAVDGNIGIWRLDKASGRLSAAGRVPVGKNLMPMAVAPDGRHLYAVPRAEPYVAVTLAIDRENGALTQKGSAPLPDSMAYASLDPTGRWLLTATYGGSKVAVSPVATSGIIETSAAHVVATGSHAHSVVTDRSGRFVYAATLGSDRIEQMAFEPASGRLTSLTPAHVPVATGDGPRHLATAPDNRFLYVLCELSGMVHQFAIEEAKGSLKHLARVASIPPEAGLIPGKPRGGTPHPDVARMVWCADIAITPDGRHLYTSERTQGRITLFRIDPATGTPSLVTTSPTALQPRGIRIDSSGGYLVVAGERSDDIRINSIDSVTGALTEIGRYACGKGANWVEIVDAA